MQGAKPESTGRSAVDWVALLERQRRLWSEPGENGAGDGEKSREILLARAAELARVPTEEAAGEQLECLEFLLSGERYAIELHYISQALPLADFTPLFCTPPFVLGITNLRGKIISIVDLRRFFELPEPGLCDLNRVMVVGDGRLEFGLLADGIVGVVSVPVRDLLPAPSGLTGVREEFLTGVTADRLAVLDLGRILSDRRMVVHEEVG